MLSLSSEDIVFNYKPSQHLGSSITIKNNTQKFAYFKFKVTRQKYYMVKPDRGCIKPNASIEINFTLHKDGVEESAEDRFQLMTVFLDNDTNNDLATIFKNSSQDGRKILVKVNGAAPLIQKAGSPARNDNYKSVVHSDYQSFKKSVVEEPRNIESLIVEKQKRIVKNVQIQEELQKQIKKFETEQSSSQKPKSKSSIIQKALAAIMGLAVGIGIGFLV